MNAVKPRLIAFYLPQYHPIPENDEWWGKGFTEWTNVAKAKPLFKGHYQPHIPADLGFYDLRVPETRQAQADMAREYGIEGFCYWHYWFAGKRLLERPFDEVLQSGQPDFPFCLAWANQSWTGIWHGKPDQLLIEQTYPGIEDYENHFFELLPAFLDDRYIRVDGKPLFMILEPKKIPNLDLFFQTWQKLANDSGLKGVFFIGILNSPHLPDRVKESMFDAFTVTGITNQRVKKNNYIIRIIIKIFGYENFLGFYQRILNRPFHVYEYKEMLLKSIIQKDIDFPYYPCIFPNWDNTPRSGLDGYVFQNENPELFRQQMRLAIRRIEDYPEQQKIIFIKSWNEWAEGNYLEPDQRFGLGFLKVISEEIN